MNYSSNPEDARFDEIIGHIEDIIMGTFRASLALLNYKILNYLEPKFQELQNQYMEANYKNFEDSEENKLIYTSLHRDYVLFLFIFLPRHFFLDEILWAKLRYFLSFKS